MPIEIDKHEARRLFLASQGLLRKNAFGLGQQAVQRALEQLSYVQIDTISVVERAHNHILWTRVENYQPEMLDNLQRLKRSVFEYWFHAAAYLPIRDYRFYLPLMDSFAAMHQNDRKLSARVLERIRQEGPLKARDFDDPRHKSTGWWNWKPAKLALEYLFRSGELMVTCREGFQKVYDLRERVLPRDINTSTPDLADWLRFQVMLMISSMALVTEREILYQRSPLLGSDPRRRITTTLTQLQEEGEITEVNVGKLRYFTTQNHLERLPQRLGKKRIHLLSPFDNLIIQRQRTRELFDFDYQLECYLPSEKRVHGYFALPILWGDQLVGRIDAKVERKAGTLNIYALGLEQAFTRDRKLGQALPVYLQKFALHHCCREIRVHCRLPGVISAINSSESL